MGNRPRHPAVCALSPCRTQSPAPQDPPLTLENPFPLHLQRDRCFPCQEPPDNVTLSLLSQLHRKSVQVNEVTQECLAWPAAFTEAMTAIWFAQEGLKPRSKKQQTNKLKTNKTNSCPHSPAIVLCRGYVKQGTYCFSEEQAKPSYLSLPANMPCWCPLHAPDPSPLTIWDFTTFVACCTPQLPPLFLLNPASVLHTDECLLRLVLDVSSNRQKLRCCGAR